MTGSALDTWRQRALEEVTLPSGMQAQIRKPRSDELLRGGSLPPELRQAVMKVYAGAAKLEELEPDTMTGFLDHQDRLVATMVQALRGGDDEEWESTTVTVDDLAGFPPDDVDALRDIGNRTRTSQQVTARSLMNLQLLEKARALRITEEDQPATIPGWRDFRDRARGAEPGPDSEGVAAAAVADPGTRPRRRRSRAGG